MSAREDAGLARILDGKALAAEIHAETTRELAAITEAQGSTPQVRVVLCGDDEASAIYARRILKKAERVGSSGEIIELRGGSDAQVIRGVMTVGSANTA